MSDPEQERFLDIRILFASEERPRFMRKSTKE